MINYKWKNSTNEPSTSLDMDSHCCTQGRIQTVFEIGDRFWAHENWHITALTFLVTYFLIIVENVSITLFRIAGWLLIFSTLYSTNNHRFSVFYTKKRKTKLFGGLAATPSPGYHPWPSTGLQLPPSPQMQLFLALAKNYAPLFFSFIPWYPSQPPTARALMRILNFYFTLYTHQLPR